MDRIYRDLQGGRYIYWTYSDWQTIYVSEQWVRREERRGTVQVIDL